MACLLLTNGRQKNCPPGKPLTRLVPTFNDLTSCQHLHSQLWLSFRLWYTIQLIRKHYCLTCCLWSGCGFDVTCHCRDAALRWSHFVQVGKFATFWWERERIFKINDQIPLSSNRSTHKRRNHDFLQVTRNQIGWRFFSYCFIIIKRRKWFKKKKNEKKKPIKKPWLYEKIAAS